ncbi:MAG: peptide-binding protein [Chrysiogenetes bacterium]|nr:peptide-binding protein [Chrysiogenetes bacterium]
MISRATYLALAFVTLACAACTRGPAQGPKEKAPLDAMAEALESVPPEGEPDAHGDWLVRSLGAEPPTLNPITSSDASESTINQFIYESLIQRSPKTLEFEPALAESWDESEDHLTYVFHLRKDVRWHDGKPFTADDVIYSFERIMDPEVDAAPLRVYYQDISEFVKIDDYTVRCTYGKPYFMAFQNCGGISVLPKHVFDNGEDFNSHSAARHPIGTGPMKFSKWETGKIIELEQNPDYYDEKNTLFFKKMLFKVITDSSVTLQAFKEGALDTVGLNPEQWVRQTSSKRFARNANKFAFNQTAYNYVGWNARRPQFEDKRVRQALTFLMPRKEIALKVYYNLARVVCSPVLPDTDYYNEKLECRGYDPARARALLAEAGWSDSDGDGWLDKDGKPFRFEMLVVAGSNTYEQIATIYKEELARAGIDMVIRRLDWGAFLQPVQSHEFDACMLGWSLSIDPDPYQLWHSSGADKEGSSNLVGFKNAEADKLIEDFRVNFDKDARVAMLKRFQEIIYDEQPYTFLFMSKALMGVHNRIVNIHFYPTRPPYDLREWFVPAGRARYTEAP